MNRELRTISSIQQTPGSSATGLEKVDAASKGKSKSYADNWRATSHHFKIEK